MLLHTGKGGVGKTTVSAATAIAAAGRGHRTLVLSTDPAHSLADVFGGPIGPDPEPIPGVPDLFAAQVDTRIRLEQAWSAIREYLVGVLAARGMAEVQAEELTVLPGAEEILALLEVRRHAESGRFDAIVVDCAPSGETLRLLALPETVAFYAGRLMGTPRRVLRSRRRVAGRAGPGLPRGEVRDALGDLLAELTAARTMLCDPHTTGGAAGAHPGAGGLGGGPAAAHGTDPARLSGGRGDGQPGAAAGRRWAVPGVMAGRPAGGAARHRGVVRERIDPPDPDDAVRAGRRSGT